MIILPVKIIGYLQKRWKHLSLFRKARHIPVWKYIVHKMQGMCLHEGIAIFNLPRQNIFKKGQIFVALSSIRHIKNSFLVGDYNLASIKVLAEKRIPET